MVLKVSFFFFFLCQLQGSVTEYEFSQEQFRNLQQEFWCKFYACCLQYQEALSHPLALHLNPHTNMVCLLKKVRALRHRELLQTVNESYRMLVCCMLQLAFRTPCALPPPKKNYISFVFRQSYALFVFLCILFYLPFILK